MPAVGLGLRPAYEAALLDAAPVDAGLPPPVDWLEAITETCLVPGGLPLRRIEQVAERYPLALHGRALSLGGSDPLNVEYLAALKALAQRLRPVRISDHLCWSSHDGIHLHDQIALPYNGDTLRHVAARLRQVQDFLGRRILIENVAGYIDWASSEMSEAAFLAALAEEADCLLLLDLCALQVNAANQGFAAADFIAALPPGRVAQLHLAGHRVQGRLWVASRDAAPDTAQWQLYALAVARFGAIPVAIEYDAAEPPLAELLAALARLRHPGAA